jgi:hypothetical protein
MSKCRFVYGLECGPIGTLTAYTFSERPNTDDPNDTPMFGNWQIHRFTSGTCLGSYEPRSPFPLIEGRRRWGP